jgi:hypothetical protein
MLLRERETPKGTLVTVCDIGCIGETYREGDISLEITEEFYGGTEASKVDHETVVQALAHASVANLVGEEAVGVAVEAGLIEENRVLEVDGTRHAQIITL